MKLRQWCSQYLLRGPSINYVASIGEGITPKDNLLNRTYLVKKTTMGEGEGQKSPILRRNSLWTALTLIQIFAKLVLRQCSVKQRTGNKVGNICFIGQSWQNKREQSLSRIPWNWHWKLACLLHKYLLHLSSLNLWAKNQDKENCIELF